MITPEQIKSRKQIESYIDQELLEKYDDRIGLTIQFSSFTPEDVDAVTAKYKSHWLVESRLDHNKRRECVFSRSIGTSR